MKVLNYKGTYGAQDKRGAAQGVDANLCFHLVHGFGVKGLEAKSTELSGLAAAGSWRFTGANLNRIAELETLELASVHGSGMISTWCDSSPGADSLRCGNNGQRVSNVDLYHSVPTDGNRSKRVGDNHTLIEDFDFWSNKDQIGGDRTRRSPEAARDGRDCFFGQPQRRGKQRAEGEHQPGKNVATSRSKDLSITHVSIIAGDK